jgi:hypothetical protein
MQGPRVRPNFLKKIKKICENMGGNLWNYGRERVREKYSNSNYAGAG